MITISIDPIILSVGHFMVRWYSVIVLSAVVSGIWIASREAERKGFGKENVYDLAIWVVPAGIIGARLFHVIDHWSDTYAANPVQALAVWQGGLAIWGGLVGGLIALVILARRKGWRLPFLLDLLAPAVVLGMGIGRLACVITGDAMGRPTSGPVGFAYSNPHALVPKLGVYYTPTPVFEMIMNFGIFAVLWHLRKKNLPDGMLFLIFLLLYATGRFFITFWSSYKTIALGLNQAQIISIFALLVGLPTMYYLLRNKERLA